MGGKQQQGGSKAAKVKVGKGKVTALQVAFMVERYLAENNYTNALAAFRSDAADLFAKMSRSPSAAAAAAGGKSMKGLMGLGEILDEYIGLKEQKLLLQRDRSRLDSAMHAFHSLFRSYFDGSSSADDVRSAASPDSSPPVPPQIFSSTPANISTPSTSNPIPITGAAAACSRDGKKRKASISYTLPASKTTKPHSHSTAVPSSSLIPSTSKSVPQVPGSMNQSIAKSLFRPGQPISIASPQTPQPNPSLTKPTPTTTCSIVSSERSIIVSPLKGGSGAAYYSVERTCQFTSPLKTDARTSGKIREHVKGKLNFDSADVNVNVAPTEIAVASSDEHKVSPSPSTSSPSSSSDGGENQNQVLDGFDFDFSDFDILNGDFSFSELLVDLDLDHDGFHSHSQSSPEQTDPSPRLQSEVQGGEAAQIVSPDTSKLSVHDSPDASFPGGHESVTSFRAITKRVKIMSPVKIMRKQ